MHLYVCLSPRLLITIHVYLQCSEGFKRRLGFQHVKNYGFVLQLESFGTKVMSRITFVGVAMCPVLNGYFSAFVYVRTYPCGKTISVKSNTKVIGTWQAVKWGLQLLQWFQVQVKRLCNQICISIPHVTNYSDFLSKPYLNSTILNFHILYCMSGIVR